jgi:hypothetical protein
VTPNKDFRLLRTLALAAIVATCAVRVSLNLVDPDLWGHVRYGQDWIQSGDLPRTATHTFTSEGHPWVNHENLAELTLAAGFATVGVPGMLVGKTLLAMGVLLLMALAAWRQGVDSLVSWCVLLLVATNLEAFTILRPQLLSFACCAVMLSLFDRAFARWRERRGGAAQQVDGDSQTLGVRWGWLLPLPLLIAVWANAHGGFAAGLAIIGAYLGGRAIEAIAVRGWGAWRTAAGCCALALASLLATLANPYGPGLWTWLAGAIGAYRPEITEWLPAEPGNPVFLPFVTLVVTTIVLLAASDRRRDWVQIAILALVGWQAAMHLRHIAFFALLAGFWLPPHAQSLVTRLRQYGAKRLPTAGVPRLVQGVAVASLAGAFTLQVLALAPRLVSLPVSRANYPVDALLFLADEANASGKLVSTFNWAQYALASLAPQVRMSFDGRLDTCYSQEVMDMNMDFLMADRWPRNRGEGSGPIDGSRVLRHGHPDYVLLDRRYRPAVDVLFQAAQPQGYRREWSLLYQDAISQVWGRSEVVDDPRSNRYVPLTVRRASDFYTEEAVEFPALPPGASWPSYATLFCRNAGEHSPNPMGEVASRVEERQPSTPNPAGG